MLLTSDPFAIADVTVAPPFNTSDHSSITWRAWFPLAQPRPETTGHDFRRADYNGMCVYFTDIDWVQLFTYVPDNANGILLLLKQCIGYVCPTSTCLCAHKLIFTSHYVGP